MEQQIAEAEITQQLPSEFFLQNTALGTPIFTAFGCVVLEKMIGKKFYYTAINVKTGNILRLGKFPFPMTQRDAINAAVTIRQSSISGRGKVEAEVKLGEHLGYEECLSIQQHIFREVFSGHCFMIKDEQIGLADNILETIRGNKVSMVEADEGIDKIFTYLIPAILAKRGRINDYRKASYFKEHFLSVDMEMPIVIVTSDRKLRSILTKNYIPLLSSIMMKHGIIRTPLTVTISKSRAKYACELRLCESMKNHSENANKRMDALKHSIARCHYHSKCAYGYKKNAAPLEIPDILICSHSYFFTDIMYRKRSGKQLLPDYQMLIINEAHKLLQSARNAVQIRLREMQIQNVCAEIRMHLHGNQSYESVVDNAGKLNREVKKFFECLQKQEKPYQDEKETDQLPAKENRNEKETVQIPVILCDEVARHLKNIRNIVMDLLKSLSLEENDVVHSRINAKCVKTLYQIHRHASKLTEHNNYIVWLEIDLSEIVLCAIPDNLDRLLYEMVWSQGIPTIMTDDVLSTGGMTRESRDYSLFEKRLGLNLLRKGELSKYYISSARQYDQTALLYISSSVPFPDKMSTTYLMKVAEEIKQLTMASNGQAAVLFTNYRTMDGVWQLLKDDLSVPMFRLEKDGKEIPEKFRNSKNGILFTCGTIGGDDGYKERNEISSNTLTMLIIVKLPFPVPDAINRYEMAQYPNWANYNEKVIIPEMQMNLIRTFRRFTHTETDTGVVAILDCRAGKQGAYHDSVVQMLPHCRVTSDMLEVGRYMRSIKKNAF
jgi:ATP-dependent DNA helicase DinG